MKLAIKEKYFPFFGFLLVVLSIHQAFAIEVRNEAERFRLIHDKYKNDDLTRPYGHEFLLDVTGHMSDGIFDFVDDGDAAANAPDSEKVQKIYDFLQKYKNTSYNANARVTAGIPLPTFDFDTWKLAIDLRGSYELGATASLTETNGQTITIPGYGSFTVADPIVQLYAVETIRYGSFLNWFWGENWYLGTDFYVKQRWDRHDALTSTAIQNDKKAFDLDKPKNITSTIDSNLKLGFDQESGFRWWVGFEDLKVAKLSDRRKETGRKLIWGDRPVARAHADYALDLSMIRLIPYLGVHNRSSYDLGDGLYAGANVEENILGIFSGNIMLDNEYLTFNPKIDLWILHLEYALKTPVDSSIDGYDNKTVHSANLRFAF